MAHLGIVADDLTGATTTGVLLARSDVRTNVYFHEDAVRKKADKDGVLPEEAIVISTNSRASKPEEAYKAVKQATEILKQQGCKYFQKRIDTTMRGRIGTEIDAMMDALTKETIAIVVPAMPKSRRILVGGYSVIDGTALINTPVARDILTPVTENYIPKLIASQSKEKVELVTLDIVLQGKDEIAKAMDKARQRGSRIIVIDAISDKDIEEIAGACAVWKRKVLSVDPGPFTAELARCYGIAKKEKDGNFSSFACGIDNLQKAKGTVLIAAGSATEVTKRQMESFCKNTDVCRISVNPERLIEGQNLPEKKSSTSADMEVERAVQEAAEILKNRKIIPAILFETAMHGTLLNLNLEDKKRGYPPGKCAEKINEGLGKILRKVIDACDRKRIAGLYTTGGDTMVHVCKQLEAECLEVLDYVIPQTDVSRLADGKYRGMLVIGKGGMTGYDSIVTDIVREILGDEN